MPLPSASPYLVTGANGFVGSNLVMHLLSKGYHVRAMVRSAQKGTLLKNAGAEVVEASLEDCESLLTACEGCAGVFHIAALFNQAGIPESRFFEINVEGTRHVFEAAIAAGVGRVIHCSTNGVHGDIKMCPATETAPYAPCDEYQRSKVEGERVALGYYEAKKIPGVVIRPAMIYGPGDTRLFKIFKLIEQGRFFYAGSGNVWCHFIDVRDLANAFTLAMEHDEINAEAFLIAGERPIMLKDAANMIADELKVRRPWLHVPVKPLQIAGSLCEAVCSRIGVQPLLYRRRVDFFIKNRCFDTRKARQMLGFEPARSFESELKDVIDWYRSRGLLRSL